MKIETKYNIGDVVEYGVPSKVGRIYQITVSHGGLFYYVGADDPLYESEIHYRYVLEEPTQEENEVSYSEEIVLGEFKEPSQLTTISSEVDTIDNLND